MRMRCVLYVVYDIVFSSLYKTTLKNAKAALFPKRHFMTAIRMNIYIIALFSLKV